MLISISAGIAFAADRFLGFASASRPISKPNVASPEVLRKSRRPVLMVGTDITYFLLDDCKLFSSLAAR